MTASNQAIVLLSGGMDSVAAMHWAKPRYSKLLAILFDYGQKNRDQELTAGGMLAREEGIPTLSLALADALPRGRGILHAIEDHDGLTHGLSPAFVPGRNAVFITSGASHGSVYFSNGTFDVVVGCNGQDAPRFPDCSAGGLAKLAQGLRHCLAREIHVVAPFVDKTKEQMLASLRELSPLQSALALNAVARSWSCYHNVGPCGRCSACVLRADAFAAVGIADKCVSKVLSGGDPAREAVLK